MKHYIKLRIKTSKKTDVILKLNKIGVDIKNIIYRGEYVELEIDKDSLRKVKKYLISYKMEVLGDTGFYSLRQKINKNMLFIVSLVFGIIMFLVLSNIIVSVNVIHENKEIRELLSDALREEGVKPLTFKKSYDEYEKIIAKIKDSYKDKIEWLEIDVQGMVINIRVEERIFKEYDKDMGTCHIVASKSGIIRNIMTERGVAEVHYNDFVNRGDILINGEIKLNDEVKNNVCASGKVYAEVWYNVKTRLPLKYEARHKTGKMRFNFMVKKNDQEYVILKSRVKSREVKNILLFKIFGFKVYLQKEYEVLVTEKEYSKKEAEEESIRLVHEKLSIKGSQIDDIINEKVLKKSINNDNLDMDIFIAVKEQIGMRQYFEVKMPGSDTNVEEHNKDNS